MKKGCMKIWILILLSALLTGNKVSAKEEKDSIYMNWAFDNDGSYTYQDRMSSWYDSLITVRARAGIDIGMTDVWKAQAGSPSAVVAVIDTGIDYRHSAFAHSMWSNDGEIANDGIDNDGNGYVDDRHGWNFYDDTAQIYSEYSNVEDTHGTHCAGIINAGTLEGGMHSIGRGNGEIRLMSLKVLGGYHASGSVDDVIRAVQYAEEQGAVICNLSIGFPKYSQQLYDVMKESGMLFVVAAGNGESDTNGIGWNLAGGKRYPACYDLENMIVVANLQCNGILHYSSCYGKEYVDIAAPGTMIYSTMEGGGYGIMTGTSMAAPMVSGVAALLVSRNPQWTLTQVREAILNSAVKLSSLEDKISTGGMLHAAKALRYQEEHDDLEGKDEGSQKPDDEKSDTLENGVVTNPADNEETTDQNRNGTTADQSNREEDSQTGSHQGNGSLQNESIEWYQGKPPKLRNLVQTKRSWQFSYRGNPKTDGMEIVWCQRSGKKQRVFRKKVSYCKSAWKVKQMNKRVIRRKGTISKRRGHIVWVKARYFKKERGKVYTGVWSFRQLVRTKDKRSK